MKKILISILMLAPEIVFSADYHGAFAYNIRTGQAGYSLNYFDEVDAINRALNECGYGCKIIARFKNACASLARSRSAYGWATAIRPSVARTNALQQCYKYGGTSCRVLKTVCTKGIYKRRSPAYPAYRNPPPRQPQVPATQGNRNLKYY